MNANFLTKPCTWSSELLQACAEPSISLSAGQTQPGDGNGEAHRQLLLRTNDYTPAWPCLYLTVQQHVLMWASSLFGRRHDEWTFFLIRKPYKSLNDQNGVTTADSGSAWRAAPGLESAPYHTTQRPQHLTADKIIYAIALLCMVLDPTNGTWIDAMQSLSDFLTRVIMNEHVPVQHRCLCPCHRTKAVLPRTPSVFKKVGLNEAIVGQRQRVKRTKFSGLLCMRMLFVLQTIFQSDLQSVKRSCLPFHTLL